MQPGDSGLDLSPGDEFAGYRIERVLGRGGMGVLYLAAEPGLERRVALKLIAPEAADDEVFARRFAEESKIAASIEHPNVVPIYAAGEERGVPYIAMRYVAGSDLGRKLAREGRLGPAEATALIAQVANGLDAIHAAGLVHRDVKPANVLIGEAAGDDHAYITDFGVARNVATASGLTQTGRFVGTLDYVAPEQISGEAVDARADVYALGCLLFKLLTGEVPFPKDGEAARLYAHMNDPPPAPSLHATAVPMALDDVVVRAMSKQPDDRYPSAGDLGRAAVAALGGGAPELPERTVATGAAATKTAATRQLPSDDGRRRGRRFALVGGLVLAAGAALAALLFGGGGGEDGTTGGTTAAAQPERTQTQRQALTRAQLIAQADAICEDSQNTYLATLQDIPEGETTADLRYSQILTGISTRAVRRFNGLDPPSGLRKPYREYVRSQEQVKEYDEQALAAARKQDTTAYLAARERRNESQGERQALAEAIGFEVCSIPNG